MNRETVLAGVFGSVERKDAGPTSDIDIIVTPRQGRITFDRHLDSGMHRSALGILH